MHTIALTRKLKNAGGMKVYLKCQFKPQNSFYFSYLFHIEIHCRIARDIFWLVCYEK